MGHRPWRVRVVHGELARTARRRAGDAAPGKATAKAFDACSRSHAPAETRSAMVQHETGTRGQIASSEQVRRRHVRYPCAVGQ